MSRFDPVHLSRPLDNRVSQTMLRHFNSCRRSGFLYAETKGNVQTVAMVRGSAVHKLQERAVGLMIENDEPTLPPELVKVLVDEILSEYPVPIEEHDYIRELAWRWASEWTIDPSAVAACETLFVLEIEGWHLRCKIDFAELRSAVSGYVADCKSGQGAPPYDEISRKRTDGTISSKNLQLIVYAVALVYGRPVTVELCQHCDEGRRLEADVAIELLQCCTACDGHGRIETIDPFPVGPRLQEVIAEFVYPGIENAEQKMLRRTMGFTRLEIDEYRESIAAILRNLRHAEETGDWPAVISGPACDECPAKALCPIPAELNDFAGEINTMDQLQQAAVRYFYDERALKVRRREIKATAKSLGGPRARVRFGADRVWELGDVKVSREIKDKDALWLAIERAVDFGEPFDRAEHEKVSESTPFAERALTEVELEAETNEQAEEVTDAPAAQ